MNTELTVADILDIIEQTAPLPFQEEYDNAGLITGRKDMKVRGCLFSLDCTEAVVEEAILQNCNLIISHHPILFRGLRRLTGSTYVERTLIKAVQNGIALYAVHTNLDNVLHNGVNSKIAQKLGLKNTRILQPKTGLLRKLVTFVPSEHADAVRSALFKAGAGTIGNYDECSFNSEGTGTFKGSMEASPFAGKPGMLHQERETRVETVFPGHITHNIVSALLQAHPYEEVAYDIYKLENAWAQNGSGLIGELNDPMPVPDFLHFLKQSLGLNTIRYTPFEKDIKTVALCGGSGSFLLKNAIQSGADAFVSADFKYHEFFDAEDRILVCDVGHYESEQYTPELLIEIIRKKIPNFAPVLAKTQTNPINYYY